MFVSGILILLFFSESFLNDFLPLKLYFLIKYYLLNCSFVCLDVLKEIKSCVDAYHEFILHLFNFGTHPLIGEL